MGEDFTLRKLSHTLETHSWNLWAPISDTKTEFCHFGRVPHAADIIQLFCPGQFPLRAQSRIPRLPFDMFRNLAYIYHHRWRRDDM